MVLIHVLPAFQFLPLQAVRSLVPTLRMVVKFEVFLYEWDPVILAL